MPMGATLGAELALGPEELVLREQVKAGCLTDFVRCLPFEQRPSYSQRCSSVPPMSDGTHYSTPALVERVARGDRDHVAAVTHASVANATSTVHTGEAVRGRPNRR